MTIDVLVAVLVVALATVFAALSSTRRLNVLVVPAAVAVIATLVIGIAAPDALPDDAWVSTGLAVGFAAIGVLGGSAVVGLVLRFAQGSVELGTHGGIVVDAKGELRPARREILRGGTTIGYLERAALIGAVAAGQPAAVAIIVAIKGLGRFSELDDSAARERFIIGTLTSLIWAGACVAASLLIA